MSNDLTSQVPEDDGFGHSITPSQSVRNYARWTDTAGWFDRDGMALPSPMLIPAINEGLQKWKDNVPEFLWAKPLPDPDTLNAAIPKTEWELDLNKQPRLPWEKIVAVVLVDPNNGTVYRFTSATKGARAAYDALKEAVVTMRMLRGTKAIPVVNLSERPWKTNYGMKKRPHFEIVGWKTPGEDSRAIAAKPTPQIAGPSAAPAETAPAPSAAPIPPQSKPPVKLASETLNAMDDVKPVTTAEIMDDEIPW